MFDDSHARYNTLNALASHFFKLHVESINYDGDKSAMESQSYRERGVKIHDAMQQKECNPQGFITKCFLLLMEGQIPMASSEMELLKGIYKQNQETMHPLGAMA